MSSPINSSSETSQTYHYPPVLQDTPMGNYLTGPIDENHPYELVSKNSSNNDFPFVRDHAYPNRLWAKSNEGVLVKISDGNLVYVPPHPGSSNENPGNIQNPLNESYIPTVAIPTASKVDWSEFEAIPSPSANPVPTGMPNNPYSHGSDSSHQLMNVVHNWMHQNQSTTTPEEYLQKYREFWIPLFRALGPSTEQAASTRNKLANILKKEGVRKTLTGTTLNPTQLSDEQLLKLGDARINMETIISVISKYDLWNYCPNLRTLVQVGDIEIFKDSAFLSQLIEEITSFSSRLPEYQEKLPFQQREKTIIDGWNCIEDQEKHSQALAKLLFKDALKAQSALNWSELNHQLQKELVFSSKIEDSPFKDKLLPGFEDALLRFPLELNEDALSYAAPQPYYKPSQILSIGDKECTHGQSIYINGMMNTLDYALQTTQAISDMQDGNKITLIYNSTMGLKRDLIKQKYIEKGFAIPAVQNLYENIMSYFENANPDQVLHINAHSQGGAILKQVLENIPPELRSRMYVDTYGTAGYIDENMAKRIRNFWHENDSISKLADGKGWKKAKEQGTLYIIQNDGQSKIESHGLMGGYFQVIQDSNQEFAEGDF